MLHKKIWVLPCAPWYKNVQVKKKVKMVSVYGLSIVLREEEEIP
jgi:hypothetical protein